MVTGHIRFCASGSLHRCYVSNGEHVVAVNVDGTFNLPWQIGRHRWVVVIPPDACISPRRAWWIGENPHALATPMQFVLKSVQHPRSADIHLLHVTDFHVVQDPSGGDVCAMPGALPRAPKIDFPVAATIRDMLLDLVRADPRIEFVVATGDLTDRGDKPSLQAVAEALHSLPRPVFPIFGGHDGNQELERREASGYYASTWAACMSPPYYSWNWGGRHFLALVSEDEYLDPVTRQMQLRFIQEDLRATEGRLRVTICAHQHPSPAILSALDGYPVDSWIHGHFHSNRVMHHNGIRIFSTGPLAFGCLDGNLSRSRTIVFPPSGAPMSRSPMDLVTRASTAAESRLQWGRPGLSRLAAPHMIGHLTFCGVTDDSAGTDGGVSCIDLSSRAERWYCRLHNSVEAPVVSKGNRVIAITHVGTLACMDAADGRLIWTQALPNPLDRWVYSPPLIVGDLVIAGTTSALMCVSLSDGEIVWRFSDKSKPADTFGQLQGPLHHNDRVFIAGYRSGSYLLSVKDGSILRMNQADRSVRFTSRVELNEARYVVGDGNGALSCYAMETGELAWRKTISQSLIHAAFVPFCGELIGGTAEGVVVCAASSGKLLATRTFGEDLDMLVGYRAPATSCLGIPCVHGDKAWIASGDGYVNCLQGLSLNVVTRIRCPRPIISPLCLSLEHQALFGVSTHGDLQRLPIG